MIKAFIEVLAGLLIVVGVVAVALVAYAVWLQLSRTGSIYNNEIWRLLIGS